MAQFEDDYAAYLQHYGQNYAGSPNASQLMPAAAQSFNNMGQYMSQGLVQMGPGNKYVPAVGAPAQMSQGDPMPPANAFMATAGKPVMPPGTPPRGNGSYNQGGVGSLAPPAPLGNVGVKPNAYTSSNLTADPTNFMTAPGANFNPFSPTGTGASGSSAPGMPTAGIPGFPQFPQPSGGFSFQGSYSNFIPGMVTLPDGSKRNFTSLPELEKEIASRYPDFYKSTFLPGMNAQGVGTSLGVAAGKSAGAGGGGSYNQGGANSLAPPTGPLNPPAPGTPPHGIAPYTETGNIPPPVISPKDDPNDTMTQLMNYILSQGPAGATNLTGPMGNLQNLLAYGLAGSTQNRERQHEMTQAMFGAGMPAIASAIGNMNDRTGLSAEAKAVLNTQAAEGPAVDYQNQVSDLKTQLLRRGAAGGQTPAALDELVRGYSPLMVGRDQTRQKLQQNVTLTDEQVSNENLYKNRALGMQAAGLTNSFMGTMGNIYDPSNFLASANQSAQGVLSGANAQNQSNQNSAAVAAQIAQVQASNMPESLKSVLLSSLLGTAGQALTNKLTSTAVDAAFDKVKGSSWWSKALSWLPFGGGGTDASQRESDLDAFINYMRNNYPDDISSLGIDPDTARALMTRAGMTVGPI